MALGLGQTLGASFAMQHGFARALPLLSWGNDGRFKRDVMLAMAQSDPLEAEGLKERWLRPNTAPAVRASILASLAPAFLRCARFQECILCYEEAARLDPNLSAMLYLGRLRPYAELQRWDEVEPCLHQLLQLPDARVLMDGLSWTVAASELLALSGEVEALKAFLADKQPKLESAPYLAPYWLGRCYVVRGEFELARASFAEGLRLADTQVWKEACQRWLDRQDGPRQAPRPLGAGMARLIAEAERAQESSGALQVMRLLPMTAAIVVICCAVWSLEEWAGGSTDAGVLYRMGACSQGG